MHMRKERDEAQDGDNLELDLVRSVCDPLRQRVQSPVQDAERHHSNQQKYADDNHEHIGFAGSGDERRQMVGSSGVEFGHAAGSLSVPWHYGCRPSFRRSMMPKLHSPRRKPTYTGLTCLVMPWCHRQRMAEAN